MAERKDTLHSSHKVRNGFKGENEENHKVFQGIYKEEADNYWHSHKHQTWRIESRVQRKSIILENCPPALGYGHMYVPYVLHFP